MSMRIIYIHLTSNYKNHDKNDIQNQNKNQKLNPIKIIKKADEKTQKNHQKNQNQKPKIKIKIKEEIKMKIGFIGGHSNKKIGASGNNYQEHLVVRDIANRCVEYAKKNYEGTFITDDVNSHSGGGEETFIINNKLDYFISIHLNSASSSANGCEIIVNCREKTTGIETNIMKRLADEIG